MVDVTCVDVKHVLSALSNAYLSGHHWCRCSRWQPPLQATAPPPHHTPPGPARRRCCCPIARSHTLHHQHLSAGWLLPCCREWNPVVLLHPQHLQQQLLQQQMPRRQGCRRRKQPGCAARAAGGPGTGGKGRGQTGLRAAGVPLRWTTEWPAAPKAREVYQAEKGGRRGQTRDAGDVGTNIHQQLHV